VVVLTFPARGHPTRASAVADSGGYKSGRSSCRGMPVSRSIDSTNSPGTPRFERDSQYQTCDCVVPIRSASGFCPPAKSHARLNASVDDMSLLNPNLGPSQPKTLWRTPNLKLGSVLTMRQPNSKDFGLRVRRRREELGLSQKKLGAASGYSQQNILTIEKGRMKRPDRCAMALASALRTSEGWLLWGEGARAVGPQYLTSAEIVEKYEALSPEDKERISRAIEGGGKKRQNSA
jgi:transcriptional regulator with XRE-family HTH domain